MLSYKHKFCILILSVLFALSCGEKVPVKQMALAKLEISRAVSVRAKQYAPQEIGQAEKKLLESHEFLRQDALDKCQKLAEVSRELAIEAYNKSVPLLAKDTLDIARQSMEQADVAYAAVLAGSEYKQAEESYKNANSLYDNKEYYPCYEMALEADGQAKDARNTAVGKKEVLSKSIAEVKAVLAEAEKYNASTLAKDKVDAANENLRIAEDSISTLELKKGFTAMEAAGSNADEAYLAAIKGTSEKKIEEAEKLHAEAGNSEGAANAKDELKASREALDQSKTLYQDSKYKESILSADESIRLSKSVFTSMAGIAKEKIAGAELIFLQAKDSTGATAAADKLKGAKESLDKSKSQFSEARYKDAIASAEESERLSNAVINTKVKGATATSASSSSTVTGSSGSDSSEDYFIYKVRYLPAQRDCLWRIAGKYYSNPFLWKNIYKANTDKIRNPNLIWPNMLLKVPKLIKKSAEKPKEAAEPVKTTAQTDKDAAPVESVKGPVTPENVSPEKEAKEKSSEAVNVDTPVSEKPSERIPDTTEDPYVKDQPSTEPEKKADQDEDNNNVITPSKPDEQLLPGDEQENSENFDEAEDEGEVVPPTSREKERIIPEEMEEPINENQAD